MFWYLYRNGIRPYGLESLRTARNIHKWLAAFSVFNRTVVLREIQLHMHKMQVCRQLLMYSVHCNAHCQAVKFHWVCVYKHKTDLELVVLLNNFKLWIYGPSIGKENSNIRSNLKQTPLTTPLRTEAHSVRSIFLGHLTGCFLRTGQYTSTSAYGWTRVSSYLLTVHLMSKINWNETAVVISYAMFSLIKTHSPDALSGISKCFPSFQIPCSTS